MNKKINQKKLSIIEYYHLANLNLLISSKPINRYSNSNKTSNKTEALEKLKNQINQIQNCELKTTSKNLVFGDGNPDSKIMLIGEGPGAQEDIKGIPFVGPAGHLLDKMLKAINLDRSIVYISNVVNFRPPNNRKPTDEEIKKYYPFLKKHIEIINPKILVLLGATALNAIIGKENSISKIRGSWINKNIGSCNLDIITTFHPAFLIRKPDQKKFAWDDLKLLKKKLIN